MLICELRLLWVLM